MLHLSSNPTQHFSGSHLESQHLSPASHLRSAHAFDAPPVDSESLLKGQKVVEIVHNGSLYKLQSTKLGKLILTK